MAEVFFDTLRSTYEYITKEELLEKINENILNQSIIDSYEININLESYNKLKKTGKKSIIKQNIDDNILPITDLNITNNISIIEHKPKFNFDKDITNNISIIEHKTKFNFDKDIFTWFTNTFKLTENNYDIIKIKDIYKLFTKSFHYNNMTKVEKIKYNKSYFVEFIEKNNFFSPYYCQRSETIRTFIKCWKIKNDDDTKINSIDL